MDTHLEARDCHEGTKACPRHIRLAPLAAVEGDGLYKIDEVLTDMLRSHCSRCTRDLKVVSANDRLLGCRHQKKLERCMLCCRYWLCPHHNSAAGTHMR